MPGFVHPLTLGCSVCLVSSTHFSRPPPCCLPASRCSLPEGKCFKPSKDKRLRTWKVKQTDAEDDYGVEAIVSAL